MTDLHSETAVTITVDGTPVAAEPDELLIDACDRHGVHIPRFCYHPRMNPVGMCRMCLVEIEGLRGFPASCTTAAVDDMVVRTNTEELKELRRGVLELILVEHPGACLLCDKQDLCEKYRPKASKAGRTTGCHTCNNNEVCDLRELSAELGITELPVPPTIPIGTS